MMRRMALAAVLVLALGAFQKLGAQEISNTDIKTILQSLADRHPTSSAPRDWLGDYYLRQSRFSKAQEQFMTAVSLNPWDPYARLRLGLAREAAGNPAEALGDYEEALKRAAYPIQFQIARCAYRMGDFSRAAGILRGLEEVGDSAALHYALAFSMAGLRRYKPALGELLQAEGMDPRFETGKSFFGERGEAEKAREEWEGKERQIRLLWMDAVFGVLALAALCFARKIFHSIKLKRLETEEEF